MSAMPGVTFPEHLTYGLCDALGMQLFQFGSVLKGALDLPAKVGSHRSTWAVTAHSDEVSSQLISLFVRLKGDYWLYMISGQLGLWAFPFDGGAAKIRPGAEKEFGTGTVRGTMKKLVDVGALRNVVYEFPETTREWKQADAADLIGRFQG